MTKKKMRKWEWTTKVQFEALDREEAQEIIDQVDDLPELGVTVYNDIKEIT